MRHAVFDACKLSGVLLSSEAPFFQPFRLARTHAEESGVRSLEWHFESSHERTGHRIQCTAPRRPPALSDSQQPRRFGLPERGIQNRPPVIGVHLPAAVAILRRSTRPLQHVPRETHPNPRRSASPYLPQLRSPSIIEAAFSAIIKVGEFVLPEVMVGMTDASAIRNPATPRQRN